jgi:hypothetical protein
VPGTLLLVGADPGDRAAIIIALAAEVAGVVLVSGHLLIRAGTSRSLLAERSG